MSTASFTKRIAIRTDEAAEVLIRGAEEQDRRGLRPLPANTIPTADIETVKEWVAAIRARKEQK